MSPREWRLYLRDILDAVEAILRYVHGLELGSFCSDEKTLDAVVRRFIVVGEAARHVPESITRKYPDVPWQEMRDMRNFATHVYWGVTAEVLWETIHRDLPGLLPQLAQILEEEGLEQ